MDKKSFFRGFGVGVLFAAIVLGISFMIRTSDPYVTSRAKELGMVYKTDSETDLHLAESSSKEETSAMPAVTEVPKKNKKSEQSTAIPVPSATAAAKKNTQSQKKDTTKTEKDTKKEMEKEKEKLESEIRQEQKELTIDAGDWSSDVSKKLESLGIVSSASDFDKYLNDNGYSSSISAGTYTVSVDDTYAELAHKITGK